jgi:hypothetical protein
LADHGIPFFLSKLRDKERVRGYPWIYFLIYFGLSASLHATKCKQHADIIRHMFYLHVSQEVTGIIRRFTSRYGRAIEHSSDTALDSSGAAVAAHGPPSHHPGSAVAMALRQSALRGHSRAAMRPPNAKLEATMMSSDANASR